MREMVPRVEVGGRKCVTEGRCDWTDPQMRKIGGGGPTNRAVAPGQ
jgi:hypothetical protein